MKDFRETHGWFDGEYWHLYTERPADARRFTKWFGEPEEVSLTSDGKPRGWTWRRLPARALRIAKRRTAEAAAMSAPRPAGARAS